MATQKKLTLKSRRLTTQEAKRVARKLQRAVAVPGSRTKSMRPLSLKSTATGKGTVVFHASRVFSSLLGATKS